MVNTAFVAYQVRACLESNQMTIKYVCMISIVFDNTIPGIALVVQSQFRFE